MTDDDQGAGASDVAPDALAIDEPSPAILDEVFGERRGLAQQYVAQLADEGIVWGLIGPREATRLWERHVLNSVAVSSVIPHGITVIDVGSGAGLPGIPLALARPDLQVVLVEPLQRRVEFLELAVERLQLDDRVQVHRGRAEDYLRDGEEPADAVTCRAVAALPRLLEWCWPLVAPGGDLLAIKGASAPQEVSKTAGVLKRMKLQAEVLSVRAHARSEPTTVVRVQHT